MQSSISRRTFSALVGAAWLAATAAYADHHEFRENRYLVVSATGDATSDTQLALAEAMLSQSGVAYDKYVATENGAPKAQALALTDAGGKPLYTGIVLTTAQILFQDANGSWLSGLTPAQWSQLEGYEQSYDVRRVALYSVPGAATGMEYLGATGEETTLVSTEAAGQALPGLEVLGSMPLAGAWRYLGKVLAESKTQPVLTFGADAAVVAAALVDADARQQLHFFFSQSAANETSIKLAPLWIAWLKKDVTAPPPAVEDAFAGDWSLRFSAFGDSFDGKASVSSALATSDERSMQWSIRGYDYAGPALEKDGTLRAAWSAGGNVTLAVYAMASEGLSGRFLAGGASSDRGSETIVGLQPNVVSGTFDVRGHGESGDFLGSVAVQKYSQVYMLQREVNGRKQMGIGRRFGNELVVAYSADPQFGVVVYEKTADGLTGTWLRYGYNHVFSQVLSRTP